MRLLNNYLYLFIAIFLNVIGQISLKYSMLQFGKVSLSINHLDSIWKMITRPFSLIGLSFYAISAVFWMAALSRMELSRAYPMLSLAYVLILIISHFLFSETLGPFKVIGILIIIIGICLVGWGG